MKPKTATHRSGLIPRSSLALVSAIAALGALAAAPAANAITYFYDGPTIGGTGNGASSAGTGVWDTTTANWDPAGGGAREIWNNTGAHTASFGGAGISVVTVSGTVNVAKMEVTASSIYSWDGAGTINFGSAGTLELNNTNSASESRTLGTALSGVVKIQTTGGTGTLGSSTSVYITGTNTGLTSTELSLNTAANNIVISNAAALGSAGATVKLTTGVLNLGLTSTTATSYNAWVTDLAGGTIRARSNSGMSTWTGATSLSANSGLTTRPVAGVGLTFSTAATVNLNGNTLTLDSDSRASGITLNGVISGGGNITTNTLGLAVGAGTPSDGTGVSTLGAANTFTGTATTTADRGTLALNHVNALQNATLNTGAAAGTQAVTFVVAGTNTYNLGALTGSDALAIGGNTISVGSKAAPSTFSAAISGSGGGFTKVGAATQTLSGANTYTGATAVSAGVLKAGVASVANVSGAFGNNSAVTTANLASAGLDITGFNTQIGSLAGGGGTGGNVTLGAATLTTGGNDTTTSYAGKISGTGGLTKIGAGLQTLTGASDYTGATLVSGGTLAVNGSITSNTTVAAGATLQGSGAIVGTLDVAGTLAAGNSIESLASGAVSFGATGSFAYEYDSQMLQATPGSANSAGDLVSSTGSLTIITGATLTIDDISFASFSQAPGTKLTLLSYNSTWDGGVFLYNGSQLLDGAQFTVESQNWVIDYNDTVGGFNYAADQATGSAFVTMTAVPEPSASVIVVGFMAAALLRRRRA